MTCMTVGTAYMSQPHQQLPFALTGNLADAEKGPTAQDTVWVEAGATCVAQAGSTTQVYPITDSLSPMF